MVKEIDKVRLNPKLRGSSVIADAAGRRQRERGKRRKKKT